jgi:hypothetical protein
MKHIWAFPVRACLLATVFTLNHSSAQMAGPATGAGPATISAPTPGQVVDIGPNHRVWQWQTYELLGNGQVMAQVHSYTELASGLNYLNASGNTLTAGEQGICVQYALTNAVILGNDFTPAHLRSVDTENMGRNVVGAIQSAQLIKNKLAGGDSFQLRAPLPDGTYYFLLQNTYVTTNGAAAGLVTEPQSLPINYQP